MKTNTKSKLIITAGFAMFTMFFGSGNLVFPLKMGAETLDKFHFATVGLLLTGILVPFIGLFAIIIFKGNRRAFFNNIGKKPAILLTLIILALLGPFGVVPRCAIVSYGSMQHFLPDRDFFAIFSAIFGIITVVLIWNQNKVVPILGKLLTPWLLLGVASVVIFGLYLAPLPGESVLSNAESLLTGIFQGYQTMDLLAAFFFSAAIVEYLQQHPFIQQNPGTIIQVSTRASLIAASLLALIYVGFVALGSKYSLALANTPPEQMLISISKLSLGAIALPIIATTICLACLTTAAVLGMQFAEFVSAEITDNKLKRKPAIILTFLLGYFISLTGFSSLTAFLGQILGIVYPALIVLAIANILIKLFEYLPKKLPAYTFYLALVTNICVQLYK